MRERKTADSSPRAKAEAVSSPSPSAGVVVSSVAASRHRARSPPSVFNQSASGVHATLSVVRRSRSTRQFSDRQRIFKFFFFYVHYRCRQQRRRTTTRFFAYPPNQCRVITFGRLLHAEQRNRTKIEDRLAALPYRKTIIKKKYIVSANDGVSIDRIIICYCLLLFFFFNYYIYICLKNLRTITCRRTGVTDRHTAADGDGVVRSGLTLCVTASRWRRFLFERYEMWPRPQSGRWCFRRWWCRPSTQCWRWAVAQDRVGYNWSPSCGRCTCWTTRRRRSPRYHLLYESVSFSNDNGFTIVIIFYWNPRLSISD